MDDTYAKEPRQQGRRTKAEQVVHDVRTRLDQAWQHERENRQEAATDLAFLAGDQWPDQVRREREAARRPMLTINRLPQFVRQVTNDIRQADLAIKVAPVDDESDPKLAKIYDGIIRQIQYQSGGSHVFASAAEHQCACGIGWFRVTTDYIDDAAFDQEIKLKLLPQPLSVYCDPAAILPDRSDAMWMLVTEIIPTASFKERYPEAGEVSVETTSDGSASRLYWSTADAVRVAEYWCKKPYKKTIGMTPDGESIDLTDIQPAMQQIMNIVKKRTMTAYHVEQYLVSGSEVLAGPNRWPGKFIPIVPVIGAEIPLDQKTYRHGIVRYARDPQQLYNYARTSAAEMIALQPKTPYLVTTNMIGDETIKRQWDSANITHRPYLVYKPDPTAPNAKPTREPPPEMPVAFFQEAQVADGDMKATTGIYDASLGARSNEQSGRAIFARQREGDVANYHFSDNLEQSLQHCGRILIDLIPHVYDNERVIRIMGEDDSEEFVPINREIMGVDGMPMMINDLSTARFDVRVTIGPSYSTKRMETANAMIEFMKAVPQVGQVASDLLAKSLDFPGAEEVAKRLRNTIPPEIMVDPDDPATQPPPPPNPLDDPGFRVEATLKLAQARKASADARKAEMETAAMFQQSMLQPEPPLPVIEDQIQPPQDPMGGPDMGGMPELPPELANIDPAELEQMLGGLPPGPTDQIPSAY